LEQNKFMRQLRWLRGDGKAAPVSSERDQRFRSEGEEVAQVAGLRSAGRAAVSNSLMHIEEQFREGKVVQDEFCRGIDEAHAANGLPANAGVPSGTVGEHSGMAIGEQWGRAERIQPWGVQSPMQSPIPAAEVIISLSMAMCMLFVHAHLLFFILTFFARPLLGCT